MSKLVEELKQEHILITKVFNKAKELGIASQEGQNVLLSAKKDLLNHLQKEDDYLYPILNKAAETDPALRTTLDLFAKDMDEISKNAQSFFHKYSNGGSGIEFLKELGNLVGTLTIRIRKEEKILYDKYDSLDTEGLYPPDN